MTDGAVVLGLDVGGTWTRALVAGVDGRRLGTGSRAGANPVAHGVDAAAEHIAGAIGDALADAGRRADAVEACVVGLAGASKVAADPAAARAFAQLWQRLGLSGCEVEIVADVTTAYAAGSAAADGVVLLAGTGAVAATMRGRRPASVHGGHGWLLGDEGSGYWIGREAVRATLAALDDGAAAPRTGLLAAVLDTYETSISPSPARPGAGLIAAVNARPAVRMATLVPLVVAAYEDGDPVAERIVRDAAAALVELLDRAMRTADGPGSIVLAGGVLTPGSCVYDAVCAAIGEARPEASVAPGVDGVAAAAWLAALHLIGDGGDGPQAYDLHGRLLG